MGVVGVVGAVVNVGGGERQCPPPRAPRPNIDDTANNASNTNTGGTPMLAVLALLAVSSMLGGGGGGPFPRGRKKTSIVDTITI